MRNSFNFNDLLILLGAAGCVWATVREARGRAIPQLHVIVPSLFATLSALILLLLSAAAPPQPTNWEIALLVGLLVGAVRGTWMCVRVDHQWNLVLLPRTKDGWTIALGFALLVTIAIATPLAGGAGAPYQVVMAIGAVFCAGSLVGRAGAILIRLRVLPHFQLRGGY